MWVTANNRRIGVATTVVEGRWARHPERTTPSIQFFIRVLKRDVRHAIDRHKLQRWLREAAHKSPGFALLAYHARKQKQSIIVTLRVKEAPGPKANWNAILQDVGAIADALAEIVSKEKLPVALKLKSGRNVVVGNVPAVEGA